jgi:glycerol-3-phosphate acyltransferase PlsY
MNHCADYLKIFRRLERRVHAAAFPAFPPPEGGVPSSPGASKKKVRRLKFLIHTPMQLGLSWPRDRQNASACMMWIEQLQSAHWLRATGCTLGAYVLGCFATGYYLVRARTGRDLHEIESGSIGARNVGRVLGKSGYLLTMLGDMAKGALAVWFASEFTNHNRLIMALAVLAVVAGHIWPAQLHFRGGKGVATSFAALLLYDYRVALTILIVFLAGLVATRKSLFPAMFAYVCLPLAEGWFHRAGLSATFMTVVAVIILFAHRRNLAKEIAALLARRVLRSPDSIGTQGGRGVVSKPEPTKS